MVEIKNKKFNLFGTEWQIRFEDRVLDPIDGHELFGQTYRGANNVIVIAKTIEGRKVNGKEIKLTLLHEIMHAIFSTGQYLASNEDEPLVEWCARCIYSLLDKKVL